MRLEPYRKHGPEYRARFKQPCHQILNAVIRGALLRFIWSTPFVPTIQPFLRRACSVLHHNDNALHGFTILSAENTPVSSYYTPIGATPRYSLYVSSTAT
jgi:hypothetical protein